MKRSVEAADSVGKIWKSARRLKDALAVESGRFYWELGVQK